ncbi:hypothetical protein MMC29_000381 [Sticta canariensis]|nr:hypothetical protein [Sticta canariensis]
MRAARPIARARFRACSIRLSHRGTTPAKNPPTWSSRKLAARGIDKAGTTPPFPVSSTAGNLSTQVRSFLPWNTDTMVEIWLAILHRLCTSLDMVSRRIKGFLTFDLALCLIYRPEIAAGLDARADPSEDAGGEQGQGREADEQVEVRLSPSPATIRAIGKIISPLILTAAVYRTPRWSRPICYDSAFHTYRCQCTSAGKPASDEEAHTGCFHGARRRHSPAEARFTRNFRAFLAVAFLKGHEAWISTYSGLPEAWFSTQAIDELLICTAGAHPQVVSFQHTIVPLLKLITQQGFTSSLSTQFSNPIYAIPQRQQKMSLSLILIPCASLREIQYETSSILMLQLCHKHVFAENDEFLEAIARCLAELQASSPGAPPRLSDPGMHDERYPESIWRAENWLELLAPVAVFLRQAVIKFRKTATSTHMQNAVAEACKAFQAWKAASQPSASLPQRLYREVETHLQVAQSVTNPVVQSIKREEEVARQSTLRSLLGDIFRRGQRRPAQHKILDGPGTLSASGNPRHDNDLADYRQISISPTMAEVMSKMTPYLPGNRPEAAHHLPSDAVDRLLDTHFRLLRHDLMNPLFENMQSLEQEAGK